MSRKNEIALAYAKLAKAIKEYPRRSDLKKKGISRDMVRDHFGTMEDLRDYAKGRLPKYFEKVIDLDIFDDDAHRELQSKVFKCNRFVITTAVAGAPAHDKFLSSIKKYAEIKKAMVLVIPANYALKEMDPDLIGDPNIHIVFKRLRLNSNIIVDPIKIDPKQVDPVVGLDAMGHTEGTLIIGSPKQRRVPIANSNQKLARIIQATGAITRPRYIPRDGIQKRRDRLAEEHHVMGAVVVEVVDEKLYHFRIVQMKKDGSFNDIFYNYSSKEKKYVGCLAIVQGDKHVGETDPEVDAAVDELCALGKPKYRIQHDFVSGISINHHEIRNKVKRAILAREGKIDLDSELRMVAQELNRMRALKTAKHIVIVKSNHDEFLDRYLAEGNFDDQNRIISTKLQVLAMEGKDPLKAGLEKYYNIKPGIDIMWLERDEDFRIAGIESGCHGDLGSNGRRNPGAKGMYKAYGKCNYGHCHYGEIWHGAMSCGTSSYKKLGYNRGSSSWDNSQIVVYDDGTRQLLNIINGNYELKD
jgi:hypothetical protein